MLERCGDARATIAAVRVHRPDVAVVDPRLPGADGLAIVREILSANAETRVVIFTGTPADTAVVDAIRIGARGLVPKRMEPRLLLDCVRTVAAGGYWFESRATQVAIEHLMKREASSMRHAGILTAREREIVRAVATGLRNRAIGEKLGISERTVKVHLHSVYAKLELDGRLALLRYARDQDMV